MANEATLQIGMSITKNNLNFKSNPVTFRATVTGVKGPTPGAITVTTQGTDVDLSQLTTPALCRISNLDSTNFVEWGIFDGIEFIPIGEILPGEFYIIRLSRRLTKSYGTGTGTIDSGNTLRFKANAAPVNVVVEAFEA